MIRSCLVYARLVSASALCVWCHCCWPVYLVPTVVVGLCLSRTYVRATPGRQLYADLLAIFQALAAVTNNGPDSVGGGGVPAVPQKPPICE